MQSGRTALARPVVMRPIGRLELESGAWEVQVEPSDLGVLARDHDPLQVRGDQRALDGAAREIGWRDGNALPEREIGQDRIEHALDRLRLG